MAESKITHPAPPPASKPSGKSWEQERADREAARTPPGRPNPATEDAPQNLEVERTEDGVIYDQFHPGGTRDTREKEPKKNG